MAILKLTWFEWISLSRTPLTPDHLSSFDRVSLFLDSALIVHFLWILKSVLFFGAIYKMNRRTYYAVVGEVTLQERALRRLCCQSDEELDILDQSEKSNKSSRGYKSRAHRIREQKLKLPLKRMVLKRTSQGSEPPEQKRILWKFSPYHMVEVGSARDMEHLTQPLWSNLFSHAPNSIVGIQEWFSFFVSLLAFNRLICLSRDCVQPEKSEGRRAFDLLFDSVKQHKNVATRYIITRTDFKNALLDFMKRRSRLTSALENWENLTIVINSLTIGIFWFIMIFVVSTIYGFDLRNVLVTLSTFVLSIAFAFGPTMAKMIESVIFIFASQPYDVGDRVSIDGKDYHVSAISLLTTQFRGIDNRFVEC